MTVNNISSTGVAVQAPPPQAAIVMNQNERQFLDLTNKERAQRGLQQLTIDPVLIETARKHSREMAEKRYFSHYSPTAGIATPMDRYLTEVRYQPSWLLVGENLFYCSMVGVDRGHNAFMNSPGHRANILEPRYERMGVGEYIDSNGEFWITEMFLAQTD